MRKSYISVLGLLLYGCGFFGLDLQARNPARRGSGELRFAVGNKIITVASNGDILSVADDGGVFARQSDPIVVDYSEVSVNANRDISVWKGNYFPSVYYFPLDKYLLQRDYRSNSVMLDALDDLAQTPSVALNVDTIEIMGACSPTGGEEYNLKLAISRCMALRSYLRWKHRSFAESYPIKFSVVGVDWVGYRILREEKPFLNTKQMWDLLQYAAIRLKMKDGSYIIPGADRPKDRQLDPAVRIVRPEAVAEPEPEPEPAPCDTVYIFAGRPEPHPRVRHQPPSSLSPPSSSNLYMALKTNLLYDAALLPNLSAEWYLGRQWSLAVEGNWSWWSSGNPIQNRWFYRIQAGGLELRKWIYSPAPLQGHALGIQALAGDYDIRLFPKDEYSKGWLSYRSWAMGLTYGYSFPLAERLNMELGLALGYMTGEYYRYNYCMEHEHWAQRATYRRNYLGLTRASLSLVWLLKSGS